MTCFSFLHWQAVEERPETKSGKERRQGGFNEEEQLVAACFAGLDLGRRSKGEIWWLEIDDQSTKLPDFVPLLVVKAGPWKGSTRSVRVVAVVKVGACGCAARRLANLDWPGLVSEAKGKLEDER